jgi:DNA-binding NarL/FixJ family response regulator
LLSSTITQIVRRGVRHVAAHAGDLIVVGEAASGAEALALLEAVACDVVVTGLLLPDVDGLELLKLIRREHPAVRILVLTSHSEDAFAIRVLKAKRGAPDELIGAIRRVCRRRSLYQRAARGPHHKPSEHAGRGRAARGVVRTNRQPDPFIPTSVPAPTVEFPASRLK